MIDFKTKLKEIKVKKRKEDNSAFNLMYYMLKSTIKSGVVLLGGVYFAYSYISDRFTPKNGNNQIYLNLSNTVQEPNMNESVFNSFEKNAPKYYLQKDVVLGSNFTPLFKWLNIKQIELIRNFVLYNSIKRIEDEKDNKFFSYDYNYVNITNIKNFNSNDYTSGLIINFPINSYHEIDNKYIYQQSFGNYNVYATISKLDEVNSINIIQSKSLKDNIYLVCRTLNINNDNYSFSNCKTEYGEALDYFTNNWKNINNAPNIVNLKTRLFYEYYALAIQGLSNDSVCFNTTSIVELDGYIENCQKDIEQSIINISQFSNDAYKDYLNYSREISSSLKIKTEDLTPDLGFTSLGYKDQAIRLLLNKYAPMYSADDLWMAKKLVNKYWNPDYPKAVLDISSYSNQDIYDLKHAREIAKAITQENIEKEKKTNQQGKL